jgi:hypothetical protein
MPSNKYIDLTLGASDSWYTAPANGYFYIYGSCSGNSNTTARVALIGDEKDLSSSISTNSTSPLGTFVPIRKGVRVQVQYQRFTVMSFRFIYAEGEI